MLIGQRAGAARAAGEHGTVGAVIAGYRRRRQQPHRNTPWSQEELAFACSTDQAHISRIESNRQHPEYSTLVRICEALELSQTERQYLLALAGYHLAPPLPDEAAAAAVLARLVPILNTYPYPVVLLDEGERQWYANAFGAVLWGQCLGSTDPGRYLSRIRGQRVVELLFDPDQSARHLPQWQACYENIDYVLNRIVALFWRVCRMRLQDAALQATVARLRQNPAFGERWEQLEVGAIDLLFIDHATYIIRHPEFGRLQLHSWRTRAASDERFIVTHFSPVDGATSHVLERLAETLLAAPTAHTGRLSYRL